MKYDWDHVSQTEWYVEDLAEAYEKWWSHIDVRDIDFAPLLIILVVLSWATYFVAKLMNLV